MRFNSKFTPELVIGRDAIRRIPTINHARAVFIENKRYRMKRRAIGDVVNRNAVSVYQTEQVLICIDRMRRASFRRPQEPVQETSPRNQPKNQS
jgi:hypothetical protein